MSRRTALSLRGEKNVPTLICNGRMAPAAKQLYNGAWSGEIAKAREPKNKKTEAAICYGAKSIPNPKSRHQREGTQSILPAGMCIETADNARSKN